MHEIHNKSFFSYTEVKFNNMENTNLANNRTKIFSSKNLNIYNPNFHSVETNFLISYAS